MLSRCSRLSWHAVGLWWLGKRQCDPSQSTYHVIISEAGWHRCWRLVNSTKMALLRSTMSDQEDPKDGIEALEAEIDGSVIDPDDPPFQAPVGADVNLPDQVIALSLNQRSAFPTMMLPLVIPNGSSVTPLKSPLISMMALLAL